MTSSHKKLVPALILILAILFPSPSFAGPYKVSRVIDGDTIEIRKGSVKMTVRLVGIDAPETLKRKHDPGQPFSLASTMLFSGREYLTAATDAVE